MAVVTRPASLAARNRLQSLQGDIMELILERGLDVGDPMPTEPELCEALGVGRNSLREALKVLQAIGVVEVRHGFGTFVASASFASFGVSLSFRGRLSLRHGGTEAAQLAEVREALETGLISLAIDAVTPESLARLTSLVAQMEECAGRGERFTDIDQDFHRELYRPLNNDLLSNLLEVFWDVYRQIHVESGIAERELRANARAHRDLLDAVAAGDRARAAESMRAHFDGIREHLRSVRHPGS